MPKVDPCFKDTLVCVEVGVIAHDANDFLQRSLFVTIQPLSCCLAVVATLQASLMYQVGGDCHLQGRLVLLLLHGSEVAELLTLVVVADIDLAACASHRNRLRISRLASCMLKLHTIITDIGPICKLED